MMLCVYTLYLMVVHSSSLSIWAPFPSTTHSLTPSLSSLSHITVCFDSVCLFGLFCFVLHSLYPTGQCELMLDHREREKEAAKQI